jgi:hypothetical protein
MSNTRGNRQNPCTRYTWGALKLLTAALAVFSAAPASARTVRVGGTGDTSVDIDELLGRRTINGSYHEERSGTILMDAQGRLSRIFASKNDPSVRTRADNVCSVAFFPDDTHKTTQWVARDNGIDPLKCKVAKVTKNSTHLDMLLTTHKAEAPCGIRIHAEKNGKMYLSPDENPVREDPCVYFQGKNMALGRRDTILVTGRKQDVCGDGPLETCGLNHQESLIVRASDAEVKQR